MTQKPAFQVCCAPSLVYWLGLFSMFYLLLFQELLALYLLGLDSHFPHFFDHSEDRKQVYRDRGGCFQSWR